MDENRKLTARVACALDWVNEIAPFERAEVWDNVGLLCGSRENEVTRILCALDFSEAVLDEALRLGAQLVVTHHPILFSGRKNLREDDPEGRLLCRAVRANLSLIAAHTNYDVAQGGVNDCLARALGLSGIRPLDNDPEALLRIGEIAPRTLGAFAGDVENALGDVVRVYGDGRRVICRVAVCGGAGGEYAPLALAAGADAYVTGEMRYHDSFDFMARGLSTLHAGHDATERIAVKPLAEGLQTRADALQYQMEVFVSNMGVEK